MSAARDLPDMSLVGFDLAGPLSGRRLCRELLRLDPSMGIILLGGQPTASERVAAMDSGADDCVPDSFDADELCARIRAVLRRRSGFLGPAAETAVPGLGGNVLEWGPLSLRPLDHIVAVEGVERELTRAQTRILVRLIRAAGAIVSNEDIWKDFAVSRCPSLGNIRVHVHALRRRVDPYGHLIETWRGHGYSLRPIGRADGIAGPEVPRLRLAAVR